MYPRVDTMSGGGSKKANRAGQIGLWTARSLKSTTSTSNAVAFLALLSSLPEIQMLHFGAVNKQ